MKPVLLFRVFFLLAAALVGAVVVHAEDLNAVKARMEHRQGEVDALRDRKVAGENNRGFLEARGPVTGVEEKIISDENSDRRAVYAALASQTKANPDTVGRQRAMQIAVRSKRGVWVQDQSGEWKQKG
jgi:uncharacterized protein YdbL (DUF1318 family)